MRQRPTKSHSARSYNHHQAAQIRAEKYHAIITKCPLETINNSLSPPAPAVSLLIFTCAARQVIYELADRPGALNTRYNIASPCFSRSHLCGILERKKYDANDA